MLKLGHFVLFNIKLQLLFLGYVVRGGILLGVFPGFLFLFRNLQSCIDAKSLSIELRLIDKNEWIKINLIGFLNIGIFILIAYNFTIIHHHPELFLLRGVFILLMIIALFTSLTILPIFSIYDLPIKQYYYQAFLLAVLSIIDCTAILIGMFLMVIICITFAPISFFFCIPLVMIPYCWFTRPVIHKLERRLYLRSTSI